MINAADLMNTDERDFGDGDFFCVEAIVANNDDPENRCRVQCVIPIIDENEIHEVWARRVQLYVGGNGFGDYFVPEVGAELVVWGRLGDTNHLFYAPLWNEEQKPSPDFPDKSFAGLRVPKNLKFIAVELAKIIAKNIEFVAEQVVKMIAQNIEATAQEKIAMNAQTIEAVAQQSATIKGNNTTVEASASALLKGNQVSVNGSTITVQSDGSISISGGGAVSISGASVTIENRPVKKVGPPI